MSRGTKWSSSGAYADDLDIEMVGSDRGLDDVTLILAPHCHGHVCVLDPVTLTAWLSVEYAPVTRARALLLAIEQLDRAQRRTVLALVPEPRTREPATKLAQAP